jgi:hypothetical protein
MLDRQQLAIRHRTAAIIAAAFTGAPILLAVIGLVLVSSPDWSSSDAPQALYFVPGIFAVGAVWGVPFWRRSARARVASLHSAQDPTAALAGMLTTNMIVELAIWEAATLIAFVAVIAGVPIVALIGAAVLTLAGDAYSFPRMSDWEAMAVVVEGSGSAGTN